MGGAAILALAALPFNLQIYIGQIIGIIVLIPLMIIGWIIMFPPFWGLMICLCILKIKSNN